MNVQLSEMEMLVHNINSKCASLRSAAAMLKDAPKKDAEQLLAMMAEQAQSLHMIIAGFREKL